MDGRRAAAATIALSLMAAIACRSSEPIPPSMPLVIPEPERPAPAAPPDPDSEAEAEATYVVAPNGDDSAPGDEDAPLRTLARAASLVEPGDTVVVRAGHYRGFQLEKSGTDEHPIRFLAEDGVTIDDAASRGDGINLEGASHIEIRGFRIEGAPRAGIRAVDCEHVTIRDNVVEKSGKWGILTGFCDDLRILNNEAADSVEQHGIYVGNTSERPLIQGNTMRGNRLAGLHVNGDVHMGGEGLVTEARIVGNVVYDNGRAGAAGINLDGVRDSVIANNLLHGNMATGIAVYQMDGGKPSANNAIVHNTIVMPTQGSRWAVLLRDRAQRTTLYNNIIINQNPRRGSIVATADSLRGLSSDANLLTDRISVDDGESIIALSAWRELTGQDGASREAPAAAELFVDPSGGDFRLAANSPARGAGRPLPRDLRARALDHMARDLAGEARPEGNAPDLGCYQAVRAEDADADAGET